MGLFDAVGSLLGFPGQSAMGAGYGAAAGAIQQYLPQATGALEKYYGLAQTGMAPYTGAGPGFLQSLQDLYTSPQAITQQPGYQFQMSEGLRGVAQQGSALGKYFSGQTGRALEQYAAGQAGTSYLQQLGMLGGLTSSLGVAPATSLAQMGIQTGAGLAGAYGGAGQNLAQLYASQGVNTANMQSQFLSNLIGTAGMAYMLA